MHAKLTRHGALISCASYCRVDSEETPLESTIARVLKRFNKVRGTKHRAPVSVVTQAPSVEVKEPNDVWTVDYKGWWLARNGERCEPLTVRDAFSRFILATEVLSGTNQVDARTVFERLSTFSPVSMRRSAKRVSGLRRSLTQTRKRSTL